MESTNEVDTLLKEYLTVGKESEITEIEKKSKFIAQVKSVTSVVQAQSFIDKVSKKHWNASHNVYAYIIGVDTTQQKCSDDGEPSGTAGMPVLEAIKVLNLVNVVVVVTRYFGGTLLGKGGLIRAYGSAARSGLKAAGINRRVLCQRVKLVVDYSMQGKIQNELLNAGIKIHDTIYLEDVTFIVDILSSKVDKIYKLIQEITADQFKWVLDKQVYHSIIIR